MTEKNNAPPGERGAESLSNTERAEAKPSTPTEQLPSSRFSRVRRRAGADKRLNRTDLAVVIALGGFSDRHGRCRPGTHAISDDAGIDRRKLDAALKRLEQFGYLTRLRRRPNPTAYVLNFAEDDAPLQAHSELVAQMAECAPTSASQCAPTGASNAPPQAHEQPNEQPNRQQPIEDSRDTAALVEQSGVKDQSSRPPSAPPPILDAEPVLFPAPADVGLAFGLWNDLAREVGLPVASVLTDKRRKAIRARLQDVRGLEGWRAALSKLRESDFLCGRVKDWRADLDFILRPDKFTKLMEDGYGKASRGGGQLSFAEQLRAWVASDPEGD